MESLGRSLSIPLECIDQGFRLELDALLVLGAILVAACVENSESGYLNVASMRDALNLISTQAAACVPAGGALAT